MPRKAETKATRQEIQALLDQGLTWKQVCRQLGISHSTIWRYTSRTTKAQMPQRGPLHPFQCQPGFPADFRFAWGFYPSCALCTSPIRAGEVVRWREPGKPRSVVHAGCESVVMSP